MVFRVNDAPVCTAEDGDFNVFSLMHAASLFMLATEFVPVEFPGISASIAQQLFVSAHERSQRFAKTLFLAEEQPVEPLSRLAARYNMDVTTVPERQLLPFVQEVREGFRQHIGSGRVQ